MQPIPCPKKLAKIALLTVKGQERAKLVGHPEDNAGVTPVLSAFDQALTEKESIQHHSHHQSQNLRN
jgi:hypothetical protein